MKIAAILGMSSALLFSTAIVPTLAAGTPQASIIIEQVSPSRFGSWTFLSSGGTNHSSTDVGANKLHYSMAVTDFGPTTLMVSTPVGMSVKIGVYRGNELLKSVQTPQYSFTLLPNDNYRFLVQYSASREGSLGITSDPSGIKFRMKGPAGKIFTGKTPITFKNIPSGQYSISSTGTKECAQPKPYAAVVEPEKRSTLHITLNCDHTETAAVSTSTRPTKRSLLEYVNDRELKTRGNRK